MQIVFALVVDGLDWVGWLFSGMVFSSFLGVWVKNGCLSLPELGVWTCGKI